MNGKFTVTNISNLSIQKNTRAVSLATRITQIEFALGQSIANALIQSGDTYSTNIPGNSYYTRYFWIDVRINKLSGSLRRYYKAGADINQLGNLAANNIAVQDQYALYFNTKRLTASNETTIAQLDNLTGFNVGDIVYLVSETQPEFALGIVELMGTNQVRFDKKIPNTYTKTDTARVFKIL